MTIHEKLIYLTRWANRSEVSRQAGLDSGYLASVLSKRHDLSTRAVLGLARALDVDPGWLIDDRQGLPPVHVEPDPERLAQLKDQHAA